MNNVIFLLLGWLLGLLSPVIVDGIKKHLKKKELKKSFYNELNDIKGRLICCVYQLESQYGKYDRELLKWLKSYKTNILKLIKDTYIFEHLDDLLDLDDEQLTIKLYTHKKTFSGGFFAPMIRLSFIDSNINYLSLFETEFQKQIQDIRAQIHFFNEHNSQLRYFYKMTFDENISDENHEIIRNNFKESCLDLNRISKLIIKRIECFVSQRDNK